MNERMLKLGPPEIRDKRSALWFIFKQNQGLLVFLLLNSFLAATVIFSVLRAKIGVASLSSAALPALLSSVVIVSGVIVPFLLGSLNRISVGYLEFCEQSFVLHVPLMTRSISYEKVSAIRKISGKTLICVLRPNLLPILRTITIERNNAGELDDVIRMFKEFAPSVDIQTSKITKTRVGLLLVVWSCATILMVLREVWFMQPSTIFQVLQFMGDIVSARTWLEIYVLLTTFGLIAPILYVTLRSQKAK